ncbi:glycosyl hydrolase family 61 [Trichoderma harzianum]|uniref:lytic cellulose monooxygenase (C4-dehydrogenating) n=1 Tax=Trichoderma harzianum TaxID=5544 RepID=A0A0F9X9Q7_TRIHA|nr:glycosyl hydrolase family 61 [Trichoderma harzianum]
MDINSTDLRCNEDGVDSGLQTETVTITAASLIGFTPSNSISHVGPLMVYMAKAPGDPSDWNGAGQFWFKINEWSPDFSTGSINWPQLGLLQYEFTIPSTLSNGEYIVSIEHLAVHNGANYGGAQFFVACGQVKVNGGSAGSPRPLVAIPGAYSPNDPGIYFNTSYPPLYFTLFMTIFEP